MRKEIYRVMLSIEGYEKEIEWDKVVRFAPKELFTEEFVAQHEQTLIDYDIITFRPKISIRMGITKRYLQSLDKNQMNSKQCQRIEYIAKRIKRYTTIFYVDAYIRRQDLLDIVKELVEFDIKFIKKTKQFGFLMCESDIEFLSDKNNFSLLSPLTAMSNLLSLMNVKYGDSNNEERLANITMELYEKGIISAKHLCVLFRYLGVEVRDEILDTLTEYDRYEVFTKGYVEP